MMPDLVADLLLPPLVERIDAIAPAIALDIRPWRGPMIIGADFSRSIDIVLSCTGNAYPGFYRQRLYGDKDALAVRNGHPLAARLMTPDGFRAARHVAVVGAGQREDMIDEWLRREGMERHVVLAVPSYLQALRMASQTDLVAFVPRRLIAAYGQVFSLTAVYAAARSGAGRAVSCSIHAGQSGTPARSGCGRSSPISGGFWDGKTDVVRAASATT